MSENPINLNSRRAISTRRSESPSRVYWRKGYTFGQSQRSRVLNLKGRNSPPPGTYNISSTIGDIPRGPLLRGMANIQFSLQRVSNLPGPGYYNPYEPLGSNAPKYSMKPRNDLRERSKSPGPSNYFPNFRTTQTTKFSGIRFGNCDKDRTTSVPRKRDSPGPGSYEIPSIFSNTLASFCPSH
jgi:hypothetical protein